MDTTNHAAMLARLHDLWRQFPGRAPNGSGATGLLSNDAQGWSQMLNDQTEGLNLENEATGKAPVTVRQGFDERLPPGIAADPTSTFNTSTGPFGRFGVGTGGNVPDAAALLMSAPSPVDQLTLLSGKKKKSALATAGVR